MVSALVIKSRRKTEGLLYYFLYLKEQSSSPCVFWEGDTRPQNPAVYAASLLIVLFLSCFWPLICRDKLRLRDAQRFSAGLPIPPGQDLLIQLSVLSRHRMQDGAERILLLAKTGSKDG